MSGPSIRTLLGPIGKLPAFERRGDLVGVDRAVEVPLGVGVGLDGDRALGDLGGEVHQVGAAGLFQFAEPLRCFSTIRRLCGVANVANPCGSR